MNLQKSREFKNFGKRLCIIALAVIMVSTIISAAIPAVNAADYECGLEEHTHTDECYELTCTTPVGEQYGAHAHGEGCYADTLTCECAEGVEHTAECYTSEKVCTLEEGDNVLLSSHTHADACFNTICTKTEHTHTEECGEVTDEPDIDKPLTDENTDDSQLMLLGVEPLAATIAEGECGTCSWAIDDAGVLTIYPTDGVSGTLENNSYNKNNFWPWYNYRTDVKSVVVEDGVFANGNTSSLFYGMNNCTSIDLSGLDTSNATDLDRMFYGCTSLTSLDVSGLVTDKVIDMYYMFYGCTSLTSLDVTNFDTSNVTNMVGMFYNCSSLTSLDVTNFNTSNVTSMSHIFYNCKSLTSLDVTNFNTSNVTDMGGMFYNCSSLTSLDVTNFNTSNVTNMSRMFCGCRKLTDLDVTNFDTSNVTNMASMFNSCNVLTALDVTGFDTSNVTDMSSMFSSCSKLTSLDVTGFDTSNVTDMSSMFASCSKLTSLDVTGFDTSNVTDMGSMFGACTSLTALDVTGFDTSNVTDMTQMFASCIKLTSLDVTGFDTSNVTNMKKMFSGCFSLTALDVTGFDTSKVTNMSEMFSQCKGLTSMDLSSFDTSVVTDMSEMFYDCSKADEINISANWKSASNYEAESNVNFFNVVDGNLIVEPKEGYAIKSVTVDGQPVEFDAEGGTYAGFTGDSKAVIIFDWAKTVTFMDGETEVEKQVVAQGNDAKDPYKDNVPVVPGMRYLGWDKAFTNVQIDLTVNALWEPDEYSLTFDVNGGDALAADKQTKTVTYTLPVGELPAATRTGYTFDGWFDGNGTKYTADTVYNVQADTTLTAQWTINEYDITYNVVGEKPNKAVVPANATVEHGDAYAAVIPTAISGYTFDGWYTDESCTTKFADNTVITEDTDLYGKWTRNLITVSGTKTWAENGEGFVRPDSITVDLYQNDVFLKSTDIAKDESATTQSFSFEGLYETDEDSNPYVYTVKEHTTPDGYVTVVSNYDITNTYNVDTFIISKNWDNTGNPDEIPASVDVELYSDDTLYKTVTLTEANGWSQTVTVPRLSAQGHTFTIKEIAVPGFSSTYETPATKDTDGDGVVDTITYVINNTYIMPQITVSGDIAWDKVPDGMTEPDMTVNLVLNDTVIDSVTVSAGVTAYSFDELDRYDDEGNVLAYTVEVEEIADYDVVTATPATDADGNIDIDITATGTFTYGALTISNTVTGEDAPADAEFTYTVTFDSTVSYPYTGSAAGTIKSGDKITLKNGESITIANILVGVKFDVTQDEAENFVTSPSTRKIEGVISATPSVAAFSNAYNTPVVTGNLEISNKVTGENADTSLKFSFKVEFDAEGSYEYKIVNSKTKAVTTVKSGDTIELAHGETAIIYGLPVGTTYKVTETENKAYKLTSTGASGTVSQDGAKASFINEKINSSGGTNVPDTGDYGTGETIALYVMQIAMLAMLLCIISMKKLKKQNESEQF